MSKKAVAAEAVWVGKARGWNLPIPLHDRALQRNPLPYVVADISVFSCLLPPTMSSANVEAEVKLAIPSRAAFDAVLLHLGAAQRKGVIHTSRFFDTPSGALRAAGCNVRLRHERDLDGGGERWVATAKGPKREGAAASIQIRPEENAAATAVDAAAVLSGEMPLLGLFGVRLRSALLARMEALLGAEALRPREAFENTRVGVAHTLHTAAGALPLTLELDETRFVLADEAMPPERRRETHWECECELPPERAARAYRFL